MSPTNQPRRIPFICTPRVPIFLSFYSQNSQQEPPLSSLSGPSSNAQGPCSPSFLPKGPGVPQGVSSNHSLRKLNPPPPPPTHRKGGRKWLPVTVNQIMSVYHGNSLVYLDVPSTCTVNTVWWGNIMFSLLSMVSPS
jgi:hypothetical protein